MLAPAAAVVVWRLCLPATLLKAAGAVFINTRTVVLVYLVQLFVFARCWENKITGNFNILCCFRLCPG